MRVYTSEQEVALWRTFQELTSHRTVTARSKKLPDIDDQELSAYLMSRRETYTRFQGKR